MAASLPRAGEKRLAEGANSLPCEVDVKRARLQSLEEAFGVRERARVEVRWLVDDQCVWWAATVAEAAHDPQAARHSDPNGRRVWELVYDGREDLGMPEQERRAVVFTAQHLLLDRDSNDVMVWRLEGSGHEPEPLLDEGVRVKARYRGPTPHNEGDLFAGCIARANDNGSYDVRYDDGEVECGVHRNHITVVESGGSDSEGALCEADEPEEGEEEGRDQQQHAVVDHDHDHDHDHNDDDAVVPSINSLVDLLVGQILGDSRFQSLEPASQHRVAAEVSRLREGLEGRLKALQEEKGSGYLVTGPDMGAIIRDVFSSLRGSQ